MYLELYISRKKYITDDIYISLKYISQITEFHRKYIGNTGFPNENLSQTMNF